MSCANCTAEALFEYKLTPEVSVFYCGKHLPKFLNERKKAGLLHITESFTASSAEALEALAPVEVEDSEVSEEDSNTKKKAAKKKAE
jgi:hypothetical protein